jgi:hypothetical protein
VLESTECERGLFSFTKETKTMIETLQEYADARGAPLQVDRTRAVIQGVKILGLTSRNGRTYLPEALGEAKGLYEGVKVNLNHPKGGPLAPRDYQDRMGVIRGVELRADEGLFGDFYFNPKHALAEQLLWDAEHAAENVGFSHNVEARTARRGERTVVEAILKVQSVDLVADPATTRSLFESADPTGVLESLTVEELRQLRPDLIEVLLVEQASEMRRLNAELDRLRAAQAAAERFALISRLLQEQGLPALESSDRWSQAIVSESFLASLQAAPDEAAVRALVEERVRLVAETRRQEMPGGKPRSREQGVAEMGGALDGKAFARLVRA